ncbi:Mov34/MPN/PAD-1 family protein [Butyricicoccus sp. OF10-2]|uniref:Mov34/MPN/PAD-1 family protein n=1 Tax=Butyricicoccus sp. OF10-2 TaxID=2292298 RepID=UPI000E5CA2D7|nr:Mov34/MPN/PAD-1 family protein [Butyricicoccus sp. OF10-2]RHV83174.1 hypothetical protein DXB00_07885 [Butyricicoccus sp. OF10-2]
MNTENNPNPMSLDDLFAASPAPVAPESTPLPEIAQTAPTETIVPEPTPSTEQQTTPFAAEQPAASQPDNIIDLFGAVVEQSEEDSLAELLVKVTTSCPVFDYASIQAEITDADMTFEQLRVKMSADCPELEARAHVSWTLSYAGLTERITDVNSTIYSAKSKLEQSKKFKDALKKHKSKDKLPVCSVKPTVTAQKKGILPFPAYKAVCESVDAAEKANAPICYIPSQNGQIYEMRRNEIGTFIAPSSKIVELDMVRAGFQMNLPRLPAAKLAEIISFFRRVCAAHDRCMEALVNVYWDRVEQEYILRVPTQQATAVSVETDLSDRPDESRYYLVMEVHSHNMMAARFSRTDDADEQATRLYMVIGRLDRFYPEIRCRFACGGQHIEIPAEQVCERTDVPFSTAWLTAVHAYRKEAA